MAVDRIMRRSFYMLGFLACCGPERHMLSGYDYASSYRKIDVNRSQHGRHRMRAP